jgi:hypothetical protein
MMFHPSKPEMMVSEGEGAVTMLNVATGARIAQHGLPHPPGHFAYSPDGQSYAASFGLGRYSLSVRDTVSNVRRINIDLPGMPTTFAWHPSGRWIAVPVTDGRLLLACSRRKKHSPRPPPGLRLPSLVQSGWGLPV